VYEDRERGSEREREAGEKERQLKRGKNECMRREERGEKAGERERREIEKNRGKTEGEKEESGRERERERNLFGHISKGTKSLKSQHSSNLFRFL
jgi:hypothetical protein